MPDYADGLSDRLDECRGPAATERMMQRVTDAGGEICKQFSGDEMATMMVERYVGQIHEAILAGQPINPDLVAGNENLLPLVQAVDEVNEQHGFSPNDVTRYFAEQEQTKEVAREASVKLSEVARYWGGWRDIPPDTRPILEKIQSGIDSGDLPALSDSEIAQLGRSLEPVGMRKRLEEIYCDSGRILSIPEIKPEPISMAEQVERCLACVSISDIEFDYSTVQEIGRGDEGTTFYLQADNGRELAVKIKHASDVAPSTDSALVVAAIASQQPDVNVEAVTVLFENSEVSIMEYIGEAPDLQDLYNYLHSGTRPEGVQQQVALAGLLQCYQSDNPSDDDLAHLRERVEQVVKMLFDVESSLKSDDRWSGYFRQDKNPLTINHRNFLVTSGSDWELSLVCIDAR